MNNSIRTSEVLNKAADLIEERGWTTGMAGWADAEGANLCLEGAIGAAMGLEPGKTMELNVCAPGSAVRDYLALPVFANTRDYCMVDALERGQLWKWNDAQTDGSSVIEVLRAAAVIEAAREDARIVPGPVVPAPVEDETSVSA